MRLPDFELERFFVPFEFSCRHVLCGSDSETLSLRELLALADPASRSLWDELRLGYTESQGHPMLRQEIAGLYESVSPEEVMVFAGAQEGIFTLTNALLDKGDHAVVVWPAYQSLYEVARGCGAGVDLIELRHEEGWRLDPERIARALRPNTKLVVVNFPHNPTGATLTESELRRIVDIVDAHGALLLSDEVYRLSEHEGKPLPAAIDLSPRALSLGVMSKSFGLAGLRIGWLVCKHPSLMSKVASFKDYTSLCNSAPSEILSIIALRARDQILARNRQLILENIELLRNFFKSHGDRFERVEPEAGCIAFPKLLGSQTSDQLMQELLQATGVLIMPGSVYGHRGNHLRIGFGRRDFAEGIGLFDEFLSERGVAG